jgi:hypothetical protein
MKFVYLASPYSHNDQNVRYQRYVQATEAVLEIARAQVCVYSPIVHWHAAAVEQGLPYDAEFWRSQNEPIIYSSSELWVLCLDGWRQSKGIKMEKEFAEKQNLTVRHLTFASLGETCAIFKARWEKIKMEMEKA